MDILKDPKIVVSLISATAAVLAAIVTIVNTTITLRRTQKNNKELEKLKFDIERKRGFLKFPEAHVAQRLEALDNHIRGIQVIKDHLNSLFYSPVNSVERHELMEELNEAADALENTYHAFSVHLEKIEVDTAHEAKNAAREIVNYLDGIAKNQRYMNLNDDEKKRSLELKAQLTDYENHLRDSKISILYQFEPQSEPEAERGE